MSHVDDAIRAVLEASRRIADTNQYLDGCVSQIDSAFGLVCTASENGLAQEKQRIRWLMDEFATLHLNVRAVAQEIASAAGRL